MSTMTAPPRTVRPSVPREDGGCRSVVFSGITWKGYVDIGEALGERSGVHVTFDAGVLEIMTLGHRHEYRKTLIAKLLEFYFFEREIEVVSGGGMTFQSERLEKGFEHDECWWIAAEPQMRGHMHRRDIDPPPDLALEVEESTSAMDRMSLFAALGVREVWRIDENGIHVHVLQADGTYADSPASLALPDAPVAHFSRFADLAAVEGETAMLRRFREHLRH